MSSGILMIAERVLKEKGAAGLREWEANLTPQQRRWIEEDWREFTVAIGEVARAANEAADAFRRVGQPTFRT